VSNRRLFFTRPLLDRASLTKALAAALSAARAYQSLDWELDRAEIQLLSSLAFRRLEEAVFPDLMAAFPVEVQVGGATVFVVPVDSFEKI
jgi:hypothetical protein